MPKQVQRINPEDTCEFLHNAQGGIAKTALDLPHIGDGKPYLVGEGFLT